MFNKKRPDTELEIALNRALEELKSHSIDSEEYAKILDQIAKLHKMKEDEKPSSVSKDTQALIAANLIGIAMIITFERQSIITTKALNFAQKIR